MKSFAVLLMRTSDTLQTIAFPAMRLVVAFFGVAIMHRYTFRGICRKTFNYFGLYFEKESIILDSEFYLINIK